MTTSAQPKLSKATGGPFAVTRWSLVLRASGEDVSEASAALETLCRNYWPPLYSFARRQGRDPHDAQDLTQSFFAQVIEDRALRTAAPERGRFRSFLLVAFKRFMANEWHKGRAAKRGGGALHVSFDVALAENGYLAGLRDGASAEVLYERRWALALLERALGRLRDEYGSSGREREFELLKGHLAADRGGTDYSGLAKELGCAEGAARVALHRLRKRFRRCFREETAETVANENEVEDEMRHIAALLAGD